MKENRKELEKQVFGVAISHLTIADFEKLIEVYKKQEKNLFLRQLVKNQIREIVSDLDYYSLLDLQKKFLSKEEEIMQIFEQRKIPLLKEILKDLTDPFELFELFRKDLLSSRASSMIIDKLNRDLVNNVDKITKPEDLFTFFNLADNDSTARELLGEKIKVFLHSLSYEKILKIQKKRSLMGESLTSIFEEIKSAKLKESIKDYDLKKTYLAIINEKISSSSQELLQNHLAFLVEKKIGQINDIEEIINYWLLCPYESEARMYLKTKFSQLLVNLSYEELLELKKRRLKLYSELKCLMEKRQIEIIPEYLEKLKTPEMVKQAIIDEDFNSEIFSFLRKRLNDLVTLKIEEINDLNCLISYFIYCDEDSDLQKMIYGKIKDQVKDLDDFSELFYCYQLSSLRRPIEKLLKDKIFFLLEKTRDDKVLSVNFLKAVKDRNRIPKDLEAEINNFMQKVLS